MKKEEITKKMNTVLNETDFCERFLDEVYADLSNDFKGSAKRLIAEVAPDLEFVAFKKWQIQARKDDVMFIFGAKISKVKNSNKIYFKPFAEAHRIA